MFQNITFLRKGTFFRFPLRNEETAKLSEIAKKLAKKSVATSDLDELFEKFKNDMLEAMMFVNSVEEICLVEASRR